MGSCHPFPGQTGPPGQQGRGLAKVGACPLWVKGSSEGSRRPPTPPPPQAHSPPAPGAASEASRATRAPGPGPHGVSLTAEGPTASASRLAVPGSWRGGGGGGLGVVGAERARREQRETSERNGKKMGEDAIREKEEAPDLTYKSDYKV